jgi:hypothetical protein
MVEPAAMRPYTPGWMQVAFGIFPQVPQTPQSGVAMTTHWTTCPIRRPIRPPTTMDGT